MGGLNASQKRYLLSVLSEINHHPETIEQLLSVRWSIGTHLEFAGVELQELTRAKLAGYGALDDSAYRNLQQQLDRLHRMIARQTRKLRPSSSGGQE